MTCEVFTVAPEQNAVAQQSGPVAQWPRSRQSLFSRAQRGGKLTEQAARQWRTCAF